MQCYELPGGAAITLTMLAASSTYGVHSWPVRCECALTQKQRQWLDFMYRVNFFWVNFSEILKHEVQGISGEV